MVLLLIIGFAVLLAGLYWRTVVGTQSGPKAQFLSRSAYVLGVFTIVASFVLGSFAAIPAGHRGVVVRFGADTGRIMDEGLNTKMPFIESVVKMSVQTQKYEVRATAASQDLQDVDTTLALNWNLDPGMAAEVYSSLGLEFIERLAAPAIQEAVKKVTARYIAEDLILKRDAAKVDIMQNLSKRLLERGIISETVSITNFKFSSKFTAAIEAKVSAEQAVLEAKNKLERVKVEAQQREAQAIGEASARIAQAEGEAQYIGVVTEAQVAANKAIAESLTPEVLQYILLDRLGEDIKVLVIPSGQGLDIVLPQLERPELTQ